MIKTVKFIFIACILVIFSIGAYAQTGKTVVVIPMFGDDAAAKWRGVWASETEYKKGDLVHDLGSSYIATSDHTSSDNNDPQDTFTAWDLVAASGAKGVDGATGAIGPTGPQGPAGVDTNNLLARVAALETLLAGVTRDGNSLTFPDDVITLSDFRGTYFFASQTIQAQGDIRAINGDVRAFAGDLIATGNVEATGDVNADGDVFARNVEASSNLEALGFIKARGDVCAHTLSVTGSNDCLTASPFAVHAYGGTNNSLSGSDVLVNSVTVTAPVAGRVTVNASHLVSKGAACSITTGTTRESALAAGSPTQFSTYSGGDPVSNSDGYTIGYLSDNTTYYTPMSQTRGYEIAAGSTVTYRMICDIQLEISNSHLTAIFTPGP